MKSKSGSDERTVGAGVEGMSVSQRGDAGKMLRQERRGIAAGKTILRHCFGGPTDEFCSREGRKRSTFTSNSIGHSKEAKL